MMPPRTTSDAGHSSNRAPAPLKSYGAILRDELGVATEEIRRPLPALAASGVTAGLTIGATVLALMAVLSRLGPDAHPLLVRFLVGNAYAMGFALVIFARTDLFTEYTTIAVLPVLLGRERLRALARLWSVIYTTNLVGVALVVVLLIALAEGLHGLDPRSVEGLGRELVGPGAWVIVLSGGTAGWLMGLLSWLVVAARETVSQLLFVWMVGTLIGLAGLHHSITGAAEVLCALLVGETVGAGGALHFLVWATVGNIIGSLLFAFTVRAGVIGKHVDRDLQEGAGEVR